MALSESAVSKLLEAFRAGEGVALIRDAVTMVLQELIEVEATEVMVRAVTNVPRPARLIGTGPGRGC